MSTKRLFLLAAAVLVLLNLGKALLFVAAGQPPLCRDAFGYWRLGGQMAAGDWLLLQAPEAFRTPGYPMFVALCRVLFGRYALVAAVACQQFFVVLTALVTGWICGRVTGSKAGALIGLALSLTCIARSYIGLYLLSDNLLCLLLTLYFACLVAWIERPSLALATAIGLTLGLSVLVRPVAQLAWAPTLAAMALRLRELGTCAGPAEGDSCIPSARKTLAHGACLVAGMALLVLPWLLRNQACFGRPFLNKSMGQQLWDSGFLGTPDGRLLNPTLAFAADAPNTRRVLAELDLPEDKLRDVSTVFWALRGLGYSEIESDDLMLAVSLEAIRRQPGKVAVSRVYRCFVFWITAEETFQWHYSDCDRGEAGTGRVLSATLGPATYEDQQTWFSPFWADLLDEAVEVLWHPSRWAYVLAALAALWGWVVLVRQPGKRTLAVALALVLAYFWLATAIPARPMYRYRMVLEPMVIVLASAAAAGSLRRRLPSRIS